MSRPAREQYLNVAEKILAGKDVYDERGNRATRRPQPSQDVEEFIAENAYIHAAKVETIGPETIRAWMAGHVRVPVEMAEFALKCMRNDNNQTESFLCAIGGAGKPVPGYLLQEREFTDRLEAMLNASKGE